MLSEVRCIYLREGFVRLMNFYFYVIWDTTDDFLINQESEKLAVGVIFVIASSGG